MITSIDTEKIFDKFQHPSMKKKKKVFKSGGDRLFPNLLKGISGKTHS